MILVSIIFTFEPKCLLGNPLSFEESQSESMEIESESFEENLSGSQLSPEADDESLSESQLGRSGEFLSGSSSNKQTTERPLLFTTTTDMPWIFQTTTGTPWIFTTTKSEARNVDTNVRLSPLEEYDNYGLTVLNGSLNNLWDIINDFENTSSVPLQQILGREKNGNDDNKYRLDRIKILANFGVVIL